MGPWDCGHGPFATSWSSWAGLRLFRKLFVCWVGVLFFKVFVMRVEKKNQDFLLHFFFILLQRCCRGFRSSYPGGYARRRGRERNVLFWTMRGDELAHCQTAVAFVQSCSSRSRWHECQATCCPCTSICARVGSGFMFTSVHRFSCYCTSAHTLPSRIWVLVFLQELLGRPKVAEPGVGWRC
jgi:hypothetical protein